MKIFLVLCLFFIATRAEAKMEILACEPEWASLVREIAKDKVEIKVATRADQDWRNVEVTTVLANMARSADLLFCAGGEGESKWFPTLIARSFNAKVMSDPNTVLLAQDYATPTASEGARVHLNPHNITKIATEFTRRIKLIDKINADFYQKSFEDFAERWEEAIAKWEKKSAFLRGETFVTQDDAWNFLAEWLGLKIISLVDEKTGAEPNPASLHDVVKQLKITPAAAIIFAQYEDKKSLFWLRDTAKMRIVLLPFTVGGAANSADLFQLFETTINSLLVDCSSGVCKSVSNQKQVQKYKTGAVN